MWDATKCDLCGDCLVRCQYVDYDLEKAIAQIKDLMEGKEADILGACVTCCACNEICPTGANPFDLINGLQEQYHSIPISEKMRKFMDAGGTMPTALIPGDGSKPALSLCVMEPPLPEGAIGGGMFDGMTVAKGGEYFCYLGYVHIGMESPLKSHARSFVDALSRLESEEIVFLHADCHAMLTKMPEYGVEVPFKATHIVEYMRDYLKAHPGDITPLNRKIAYQRPCASRYSPDVEPALDELFDLMGVERVERQYDRESALCCGGMFSRIDPDRINPIVEANIEDAVTSGGEGMVFLCPLCLHALAGPVAAQGLKPLFITQLARMALGELPFPEA